MISYDGLLRKLEEKGLTRTSLSSELGISSRTIAKIARGEKIANRVLAKIAAYLNCDAADLCREISGNALLQRLRDEKSIRLSGGIYHELQVRMTYNSNRIEGSKLSEDQTRMIFETNTVGFEGTANVNDIIETVNHFRAVDYAIDKAEEPLSEDFIKHLHFLLKQGTKDASLSWLSVGEYKKLPNVVGGEETASPSEVPSKMKSLLDCYMAKKDIKIEDIAEFHYLFEKIHPFQDGNGRVGRLIALKECLRHNLIPPIIEDRKKAFYYRGLREYPKEKGYLEWVFLDAQDAFDELLSLFEN